jgi:DNA-binding MarR family transcriptional regulator
MSRAEPMRVPVGAAAKPREGARIPTLGEIGLDHFAPYLLNRIVARWNADLAAELKKHDLNTIQMRTLAVLSLMSGATVNELSVYTVTEQSTMSRALDGMERDGLVRRQQRPHDMRVREVHVTEAGREAFRRFWPEMHAAFADMFAGISEAEYETLVQLLTRVLRNIRRNEI